MLKAWTPNDDGDALLILGLTFGSISEGTSTVRHYITLWRENFDIPMEVSLITDQRREQIAETLLNMHERILRSRDEPIWHCVTKRNQTKTLHVCLSHNELLLLRKRPMVSYYRLSGTKIKTSFDILIIGATSEKELVEFLQRVNLIDDHTHVELDQTQLRC